MNELMKRFYSSWKTLKDLSKEHMGMLMVQIFVYCALICYNTLISPFIISSVYSMLENQNKEGLYTVCLYSSVIIIIFFVLCYMNNVYLDINSYRITLTSMKNACKKLFDLKYDVLNRKFAEMEIVNRIETCTDNLSGVFPLLLSSLANVVSIILLMCMAGRVSIVLLLVVILVVTCSYILSSWEAKRTKKYEEKKQIVTDKAADSQQNAIYNIDFAKMYEKTEASWDSYREHRKEMWEAKWKQELIRMVTTSTLEVFTSVMRVFLGASLFEFYRRDKIDTNKVASSFSVFDQMKGVAGKFSEPIRGAVTCSIAVQRYEDLLDVGVKNEEIRNSEHSEFAITLKDVSYCIDDKEILKDINLNIKKGEKIAILGGNGSGKTTLLRLIAGLYNYEKGHISVENEHVTETKECKVKRSIAYIPSRSYMYSESVRDNIEMNGEINDLESLYSVCDLAGLERGEDDCIFRENATQLSGGQMQRVNIARGLTNDASIILADEPEAGLPVKQGRYVLNNILQNAHTAVVITHQMQNLDLFSRVVVLQDGEIVVDSSAEDLLKNQYYMKWHKNNEEEENPV